jgi:hypothetical protein
LRIVRNRSDARWLPSRFNFALFRLFAFLRLRSARPEPHPGLMLSIDRYQSAAENYLVCMAMVVVVAFYFAAIFDSFAIALPAAIIWLQLHILIARAILRVFRSGDSNTVGGGSLIIMFSVIAVAVYFALRESVALYAARVFLAIVVLNAIAAAVMFLLRRRVAEIEGSFE